MKIFVISLLDEFARRENSKEQLATFNLKFEFFDALEVTHGWKDFFSGYDEKQYLINTGRTAVSGEIGCYASHLALWKKCVEINRPIMIMEDDFLLKENFGSAFTETQKLIQQYGFIRLQSERRGKTKSVKRSGPFKLVYYNKMPHSLMCYAITPCVAKAFIQQSTCLTAPVDVMVKKIWEHRQRLYGLMPYPVVEHGVGILTNIQGRVKPKKNVSIKLQRFLTKIMWIVKRYQFTFNFNPPSE